VRFCAVRFALEAFQGAGNNTYPTTRPSLLFSLGEKPAKIDPPIRLVRVRAVRFALEAFQGAGNNTYPTTRPSLLFSLGKKLAKIDPPGRHARIRAVRDELEAFRGAGNNTTHPTTRPSLLVGKYKRKTSQNTPAWPTCARPRCACKAFRGAGKANKKKKKVGRIRVCLVPEVVRKWKPRLRPSSRLGDDDACCVPVFSSATRFRGAGKPNQNKVNVYILRSGWA
jgi:hypothetical protein